MKKRYTITEAADILNIRTHTLRYWEEELELEIPRNEMGHRVYYEDQIEMFEEIRTLKEQGYQLTAIRMQLQNKNKFRSEECDRNNPGNAVLPQERGQEKKVIKLEQFQLLMNEIVRQAMEENNQQLCTKIEERILKEMNYLMREQEEASRERYLEMDRMLRQLLQKKMVNKEKKSILGRKKEAVTKCSPLTNTL